MFSVVKLYSFYPLYRVGIIIILNNVNVPVFLQCIEERYHLFFFLVCWDNLRNMCEYANHSTTMCLRVLAIMCSNNSIRKLIEMG